jgi:hypothetical protein
MQNGQVHFTEVFKEGWKLTKENIGFLCGYTAIILAGSLLGQLVLEKSIYPFFSILGILLFLGIPYIGLYRSAILLMKGIKPQFDQLYSNWKLLFPFAVVLILLFAMFLVVDIVILFPVMWVMFSYGFFQDASSNPQYLTFVLSYSLIAIAISTTWMFVRFGLFPYFIIDKNCSPINALKESYRATRGHTWLLVKINLVTWLFALIGVFTYGIISIITSPLMTLVLGMVYRKLTNKEMNADLDNIPTKSPAA